MIAEVEREHPGAHVLPNAVDPIEGALWRARQKPAGSTVSDINGERPGQYSARAAQQDPYWGTSFDGGRRLSGSRACA